MPLELGLFYPHPFVLSGLPLFLYSFLYIVLPLYPVPFSFVTIKMGWFFSRSCSEGKRATGVIQALEG